MRTQRNRMKRTVGAGLVTLLASNCAFTPPQEAPLAARPQSQPVRTLTSFSDSLRCMDLLYAAYGVRGVVLTSQGIPDATGEIKTGTKEMMISAISRMSTSSSAFTFVDFDQSQIDVNALQNLVGFTSSFIVPNYYIRGAITQLDEKVVSENIGGGISISDFDLGASKDQVSSVVAVDLNVGDLLSRQILSGTSSGNSIAVTRRGTSVEGGGSLSNPELGINLNVNFNRSEGMHQAVRTLVELSVIESLGKLTQVPYWRCLGIEQTNPAVESQAREWFNSMKPDARVRFVQRALKSEGLFVGEPNGVLDAATKDAIGAFKAANGLIADGRIDFDLYALLIGEDLALGQRPKDELVASRYTPSAVPSPTPLALNVTTPLGPTPVFRTGDKLQLSIRASRDAFAYCYYQDHNNAIARVFPNRFQPNALVAANAEVKVPGPGAKFELTFEKPAVREEVACLASTTELGTSLPSALKQADLTPLQVKSLGELIDAFRRAGPEGVVVSRLPITVAPN